MMGLRGTKPAVNAQRKIIPAEAHGVKCVSMGFMVQDDMAVAWRGPMVGRAVTQLVEDVEWGELDYLVVDLPPGTGDIILSLCQAIPLSGAVVVSTPQSVAFADVVRAVRMFSMLKVEMIGLVENMAYFRCPDNDKDYEIFGPGRSKAHCEDHGIPFLGRLPLDMLVSPNADAGLPIVVAEPASHQAQSYREIAGKVASQLAILAWKDKELAQVGEGFFGARPAAV
jgi:ATP-binding protein involved in chromosome partitioning